MPKPDSAKQFQEVAETLMGPYQEQVSQALVGITNVYVDRERACREGHILRKHDGSRMFWLTKCPTAEEIEDNRKALRPFIECGGDSYCVCCDTHFRIPSVYESIAEHGVCNRCLSFVQGRAEGVAVDRAPTLEEALAAPLNDIRQSEVWVIRQALVERMEKP